MQVIVQGTGDDNSKLFLNDHEGIIITVEAIIDSYMTDDISQVDSCSALQSERDLCSPTSKCDNDLEIISEELQQTRKVLEKEREISASEMAELLELKHMLAKEKQKVKRIWWEKCKQMLIHEDQLEGKVMEISSLRSQIILLQLPLRHSPDAWYPLNRWVLLQAMTCLQQDFSKF